MPALKNVRNGLRGHIFGYYNDRWAQGRLFFGSLLTLNVKFFISIIIKIKVGLF